MANDIIARALALRALKSGGSGGGTSGYSPTIKIEEIDGGHRLIITDVNGTNYVDVLDGKTPDISIAPIDNGYSITIGTETFSLTNGISVSHEWDGSVLKITSASGTSETDLRGPAGPEGPTGATGPQGPEGPAGANGFSPRVLVEETEDGVVITATDHEGTTSATIPQTQISSDDIQSIISQANIGYLDYNNTIYLDNTINGVYTLRYEDWVAPLEEYDPIEVNITDDNKEYSDFILINCAPANAKRIGVYKENKKVGYIRLSNIENQPKAEDKLYSFAVIADPHGASPELINALQHINTSNEISFIFVNGGLTDKGTEEELTNYQSAIVGEKDVYSVRGYQDIALPETTLPAYYSFAQGDDVFVAFGISSDLFTDEALTWLKNLLETNRNKRCFIFEPIRPYDPLGEELSIYTNNIWQGEKAAKFEELIKHYNNAILFHSTNHLKFDLQKQSDLANYDDFFWVHSIHTPSLALPTENSLVDATISDIYAMNEGYVIDVYSNGIITKGISFENNMYLPIAIYWLDTTINEIDSKE